MPSAFPEPPPDTGEEPSSPVILPTGSEGEGGARGSWGRGSLGAAIALGLLFAYVFAYPPVIILCDELDILEGDNFVVEKSIVPLVFLYEKLPPYKIYIDWLSEKIDL